MMHTDKPAAARKDSHLDLALDPGTRSGGENGFDRISFTHCALPEFDGIDGSYDDRNFSLVHNAGGGALFYRGYP